MTSLKKTLRMDSKGRIALGEVAKRLNIPGLSGFTASFDPASPHRIILEPVVELSASDAADNDAVTRLSLRDSQRLVELLDAAFTPSAELKQAAAAFKEWERRD